MIDLEFQTDGVVDVLQRLGAASKDATPAMQAIAAIMGNAVEENFAMEGRPRWLGLKPETLQQRVRDKLKSERGKFKNGAWSIKIGQRAAGSVKILQRSGRLAASISQAASTDTAEVGTNVVYAAIQNFGGETKPHVIEAKNAKALAFNGRFAKRVNHPGSKIPARPFLMLTDTEEVLIETAVVDYLRRITGGY
ncbi:phage virion morphogenesis protein [Paludibacterium yongneupense]|uniref:phage virion morphogenesis protein n=1 Tax=Paludibacterium yongneupense TaxID=400061 RepID=UPI00041D0AE4|nr:phage virion morphogenesis protein [Paludibacterium yongneupense]